MADLSLEEVMASMGVQRHTLMTDQEKNKPYTRAGIPSMKYENQMGEMSDDVGGVTIGTKDGRQSATLYNPNDANNYTRAHEYEHVLANQGLGGSSKINTKFDELVGGEDPRDTRRKLVQNLITHAPYLKKEWGMGDEAYFTKAASDQQGPVFAPNMLYEQLASLSSMEQKKGRRLVDDKYVRDNLLTTPALREAYDAVTGLRQTRLDARDLPPYTRLPEKRVAAVKPPEVPKSQKITDAIIARFMAMLK